MRSCQQTPTQNVLQHGIAVARHFKDLQNHYYNKSLLKYNWRLPDWVYDPRLWRDIFDYQTIIRYQIYHDCGKPYCLQIDKEGKQHFPNHATISANIWLELKQPELEADLMRMDMDIHTIRSKDVDEFIKREEAPTLLVTGLCELHANAALFGGLESTSFKIKWKRINQYGKKIVDALPFKREE